MLNGGQSHSVESYLRKGIGLHLNKKSPQAHKRGLTHKRLTSCLYNKTRDYLKECQVSNLVLLEVVLEDVTSMFIDKINFVSIFILLDVVLEVELSHYRDLEEIKFQSLFCWMLIWKSYKFLPICFPEQYCIFCVWYFPIFSMSKNGNMSFLVIISESLFFCFLVI